MANKDFFVKNGLQVQSNVVIGAYTGSADPIPDGLIVSGNVGIGTSLVFDGDKLDVAEGNVRILTSGYGLAFPDGTFQTTAAAGSVPGGSSTGAVQYKGANDTFAGDSANFYYDSANHRLGIGTGSTTNATLYVKGNAPSLFNTKSGSDPQIIVGSSISYGATVGYNSGDEYGYLRLTSPGFSTDMLNWTTTGIGINGVNLPVNALDVSGGAVIGSGGNYAGSATAPSNGLIIQGSVGIGTYGTPAAKMEIRPSSGQAGLMIKNSNSSPTDFFRLYNDTNISKFVIDKDGQVTTGIWNGTAVAATYGGTGQTTYTTGDTLYASASNTLSKLAIGSTGNIMVVSSGIPSWGTLDLASNSAVGSSLLGLSNGGTNASLTASNGGIVYSDASAMAILSAAPAAGNVLLSGGAGAPSWGYSYSSSNLPNTLVSRDGSGNFSAGTITASTGMNVVSGGATITGASTIVGNLTVSGNIIVAGDNYILSSNVLTVNNPIIYVAQDNPSNLYDLGIVGSYNNGSYLHTGIVHNHSDNYWTVFDSAGEEPNTTIDWSEPGLTYGGFKAGNIIVSGTTQSTSTSSGALRVGGGVGITGAVNIGSSLYVSGKINSGDTATVSSLVSNGTISGTTITGSVGLQGDQVKGNVFNATNTAIVGSLTSNSTVQSSGAITGGSMVSNTTVTGNSFVLDGGSVASTNYYTLAAATLSTTQVYSRVDAFNPSEFRAVEYEISITANTGAGMEYETTRVSVIHNGSTAYAVEWSQLCTNGEILALFDANYVDGTTVELVASALYTDTTFRMYRRMWGI